MAQQSLADVRVKNYGGDLLIVGEQMSPERFEIIRGTLPVVDQEKVIGWRIVGTIKGI